MSPSDSFWWVVIYPSDKKYRVSKQRVAVIIAALCFILGIFLSAVKTDKAYNFPGRLRSKGKYFVLFTGHLSLAMLLSVGIYDSAALFVGNENFKGERDKRDYR